jgi:CheY-like chemotaxis protein
MDPEQAVPASPPPDQERILAHRMELLGLLGRDLAHQSNNDLAAILGFASVMRRRMDVPADLRDASGMLNDAGTRLSRVVQPLVEAIRARPAERVPVPLAALVRQTLDLAGPLLDATDVIVDIDPNLPEVPGDAVVLRQALLALVVASGRALRDAPSRGRLHVRAGVVGEAGARRAMVELEDDGPAHRSPVPGGATVQEIVASHGGTLRMGPATGAAGWRTVLELPVDQDALATPQPAARGHTGTPATDAATDAPGVVDGAPGDMPMTGKLLVVDDEEFVRRVVSRLLEREGFSVVVAASGLEAVSHLARGGIGAVLCDHRMPDLTGLQVAACAIALQPQLAGRFLVMSGDPDDDALVAATRAGRIRVLAKPFDASAVAPLLRASPQS